MSSTMSKIITLQFELHIRKGEEVTRDQNGDQYGIEETMIIMDIVELRNSHDFNNVMSSIKNPFITN